MDKRRQKGIKTKQAIIFATEEILNQRESHILSTRAIAQKAGISQSSLYHHFNSLEDILIACLRHKADQALNIKNTEKFNYLHDYFEYLLQFSMDNLQILQNTLFSIKSLHKEKTGQNQDFRLKMINLGHEFVQNLTSNIKLMYGKDFEVERLELIVFAYTMFRNGFIAHTQIFKENSPFNNIPDKTRKVLKLFSSFLYDGKQKVESQRIDTEKKRSLTYE